jgi:hypothetical protein
MAILTTSRIRLLVEILLIIIILFLFFRQKGCSKPVDNTDRGTADSTFYWKNAYAQTVASQKATAEQFSAVNDNIKHLLDSVARVYDTKTSRIQEMLVAVTRGVSNLVPSPGTREIDTFFTSPGCPQGIRNMRQTFTNPYYTAKVQIGDSSYHRLESIDTMTVLWKTVKEGNLFNRKELLQLDIHFADTSRKVTGLTSFRRVVNPKQFSFGPEARLLWLDREIRSLLGLNLSRETGRFHVSLSGGKDFTRDLNIKTNGWYGETRAVFKLLKL